MRRGGLTRAVCSLALALALAACAGGSESSSGKKAAAAAEDAFVIGVNSEPTNLNPILGFGPEGATKIFDGLVSRDANLDLVPALAAELPEVTADGRTVTVRLRNGVRFHDGTPLTAQDVVFTYRTVLDPKVNTTVRSDLGALETVEAPDQQTVVFHLKEPDVPFVQRLTLGIIPEHLLRGQDVNTAAFNTRPVGTGPFVFQSWTPGERLVLEANEDYWDGTPKLKRVVVAFIDDDNVRAARMEAGDLDATHINPKAASRFRGRPGLAVHVIPSADYRAVALPSRDPVTADLAIRKALARAVDREALVRSVLDGAGSPAWGPVSPLTPWFNPAVIPTETGPEVARQILDDGGWKPGAGGVRQKDGLQARFTLLYPASDSLRKDLALAFASAAKDVGIEVEVLGLGWDAIDPRMNDEAVVFGWGTPYDPDFHTYELFHSSFAGNGYFNPTLYKNPEVDRLLETGRRTLDPAARRAAYQAFQEQVVADQPWAWLVYLDHVYVVRGRWTGLARQIEPHAHGLTHGVWWNLEDWAPAR